MLSAWLLAWMAVAAWPLAAPAADITWTRVFIDARLDNDGVLHVQETHELEARIDLPTYTHVFSVAPEQQRRLLGVYRLDEAGRAVALSPGTLDLAHRYVDHGPSVEWSVRDASAPARAPGALRYRIDYELRGALTPAWDLPHETGPFPLRDFSFRNPLERGDLALAVWQDVRDCLQRCYRLDHDVLFPNRDWVNGELRELSYRLAYGSAWRLLHPQRELAVVTPDVNHRVQRHFAYLPAGRPAAVDIEPALWRAAPLPGLLAAGLLVWLGFLVAQIWRRLQTHVDPEVMAALVRETPPEVLHTWYHQQPPAQSFTRLLDRWFTQGVIGARRLELPPPATRDELELTLQVPRTHLHPAEQAVAERLFGDGTRVTSDQVRAVQSWMSHEADRVVDDELIRAAVQDRVRRHRGSPVWRALAGLVAAAGIGLVFHDTMAHDAFPYGIMAGVLGGGLVATWPMGWWHIGRSLGWALVALLPWLLLPVVYAALMLVPSVPPSAQASVGMALLILAGYVLMFAPTGAAPGEAARRVDRLWRARDWARRQLRRDAPALQDASVPHLEALGLGAALQRWRERHQLAQLQGAGGGAGMMSTGMRPFTGVAPPMPPHDWMWVVFLCHNPAFDDDDDAGGDEDSGDGGSAEP